MKKRLLILALMIVAIGCRFQSVGVFGRARAAGRGSVVAIPAVMTVAYSLLLVGFTEERNVTRKSSSLR